MVHKDIAVNLARAEGGEAFVHGDHGAIDVVTDKEIVVVARVADYQRAIGSVLCHWVEHCPLKPRIHLYGRGALGEYCKAAGAAGRLYVRCTSEDAEVQPADLYV